MTTNTPNTPPPPSSAEVQNRVPYDRRTVEWHNVGLQRAYLADIYYYLLAASWRKLLGWAFVSYVAINFLFSLLYFIGLDGITGAQPGSFSDAFFFSVQTFSTIGFGAMSPNSPYTHVLVTIESFAGLVAVALTTGLIFAKFSRPTAALRFSEKAVIHDRDGVPHLHLRIVNERQNEILNAHLTASVLIEETTNEGHTMRRIYRLPLVR
ncbi:MAG: hypothetical protein KDD89_16325, partial [Anaerolineales bacterium]|nr:hypothetical protein [Anaerolineales bacterium]